MTQTVKEALFGHTASLLKKLASMVAKKLPTRKADLIDLLLEDLLDRKRLQELWEKLGPFQCAAVSETLYSPTLSFDSVRFQAKYGESLELDSQGVYSKEKPQLLGLFIHHGVIPSDLAKLLKSFVPIPKRDSVAGLDTLPETHSIPGDGYYSPREDIPVVVCQTEKAALHDLLAVLRLIDNAKISASDKTKKVGKAGQRAIAEVLYGGDYYAPERPKHKYEQVPESIKAFAWPLLLQSARLAELAGTRLRLTAAGVKALSSLPHQTIRTVWESWLQTTILDEMSRVEAIRGQGGKGKRYLTSALGRRAVVVEALVECPLGRWIAFEEFSRFMRASGYVFEITRDAWTLYLSDSNYGSLGYAGFGEWDILQERYMRAFLLEYAATLGLIDVTYIHPADALRDFRRLWGTDDLFFLSRYDGLLYFRITNIGAWCLGLADRYERQQVEEEPLLKVMSNHDIVAVKRLPPGDMLFLNIIAVRIADSVWVLERSRLLGAVEKGHSLAEVKEFLTAKSNDDLPETVKVFLEDVSERASCLTEVGKAVLVEADSEEVALLITHDSRLKSLCMPAGSRHLVVLAQQMKIFSKELRKLGYALQRNEKDPKR